jgi:hypothetical protein
MPDFMNEWWFLSLIALVCLALVIVVWIVYERRRSGR